MNRLPLVTQTLYSELLEQLTALDAHRTLGHLPGCFTYKTVKDRQYVYFQTREPGGISRQIYLGPATQEIERFAEGFADKRLEGKAENDAINRLCSQLRLGGANITDPESARVLKALSDSGFFRLGGVLIGTHAFGIIGNILGIKWEKASLRTQDIDIAGPLRLEVAINELAADVPSTLESLNMGFIPIPPLNHKHPSTSFKIRGRELRVDVLTPMKKPSLADPVYIPRMKTAALPLMFLDYLIERPVQAAVIDGGGVLVSIPDPAMYALHKLIVAGERDAARQSKSLKDVFQSAQIVEVLASDRPGDLESAWEAIITRGKGWQKRVISGIARMRTEYTLAHEVLMNMVSSS